MNTLILGLVIFFACHSFRATPALREAIIDKTSQRGFRLIISLMSLVSLYYIIVGYASAPFIDIYHPPVWTKHLTMLLMVPVFPLLFAAYLKGHMKEKLKHPMLIAIKIWAIAHLIANGDLKSIILFGTFLLWAGFMRAVEKKYPSELEDAFARPGTQFTVPKVWYDVAAIVIGLVAYILFIFKAHPVWIGVPLI